jgi:hypothetical protein
MNQPSSTITAAFLAAQGMAILWAVAAEFFGITASEFLVSSSTGFVAGLVGYFWPERVYPDGFPSGGA